MTEIAQIIREATSIDAEQIHTLLREVELSTSDILATGTRYWLAEDAHSQPIGVIGLEFGVNAVLLRSAAVLPTQRGQGIGAALVQWALGAAAREGYQRVYLFSTGAGTYWTRLGFWEVPVSELVAALPDVPQVREYDALGWLPTEVAWRNALTVDS